MYLTITNMKCHLQPILLPIFTIISTAKPSPSLLLFFSLNMYNMIMYSWVNMIQWVMSAKKVASEAEQKHFYLFFILFKIMHPIEFCTIRPETCIKKKKIYI